MSRRIEIDLTDAADAEVDRLEKVTGLSAGDIFRASLSLFRIVVAEHEKSQPILLHAGRDELKLPFWDDRPPTGATP